MRALGVFLTACVVLAAVRAALAALVIALLVSLVWSAAARPRETAALFGLVIVASLVQNHGLAFLSVVGIATIAGAFLRAREQRTGGNSCSAKQTPSCPKTFGRQ